MVKVAIGIPHSGGTLEGYFVDTLLALKRTPDTHIVRVAGKPVDLARNMLAEGVVKAPDITHLFMMDADMRFPIETIIRLIQADKDVVSGTYFSRVIPPIPHIYDFHHEDNEDGTCPMGKEHGSGHGRWYKPKLREVADYWKRHPEFHEMAPPVCYPPTADRLVQADALGAGCMLIKREVLEAMEWPYFKTHDRTAGGEDFYFCEQARARGFEIWADLSVQCQHEIRGAWNTVKDSMDIFRIGKEDEHDFEQDFIVDMSPKPQIVSEAG